MSINRRNFLAAAAALPAVTANGANLLGGRQVIRAVAFDALVLFDFNHVQGVAEGLFPGNGADLFRAWKTRQFEYAWLRAITHTYVDFWQITRDSLSAAAEALKLDLKAGDRDTLLATYLELRPWPDVEEAIPVLKRLGLKLAILSNFTDGMLRRSGVIPLFDHVISTDHATTYKPAPKAYQLAVDAFGLSPSAILFAAFAPWDAAGAKTFGFPTIWVNRSHAPWDPIGKLPDYTATGLAELTAFIRSHDISRSDKERSNLAPARLNR